MEYPKLKLATKMRANSSIRTLRDDTVQHWLSNISISNPNTGVFMFQCSFELNGQPLSVFKIGAMSFPAFSGNGTNINKRSAACLVGVGPIPPGEYYIFDRQGGGFLEPFKNIFSDHKEWFALYAIDAKIDDETYCDKVKRGNFRLHPKGPRGISEGCITIEKQSDFHRLRAILKSIVPEAVPNIDLKAYGRVTVK